MSLFDGLPDAPRVSSHGMPHVGAGAPLAERMRPRTLDDYVGQEHLLGPGKPLRVQIERDGRGAGELGSMIFWGPPGVGKTTLAKIIAETTQASFIEFSAVLSGIKEIKQVMATAAQAAELHSRTILIRGRDSSLQQGAAGRISALRGARDYPVDRGDDGESVVSRSSPRCSRAAASTCCNALGEPEIAACCAGRWRIRSAAWARWG